MAVGCHTLASTSGLLLAVGCGLLGAACRLLIVSVTQWNKLLRLSNGILLLRLSLRSLESVRQYRFIMQP